MGRSAVDTLERKKFGDDFNSMGIMLFKHSLVYGYNHGHLRWLPFLVRRAIIRTWNFITCRLVSHDILDEFVYKIDGPKDPKIVCSHCSKEFTREEYNLYLRKSNYGQASST